MDDLRPHACSLLLHEVTHSACIQYTSPCKALLPAVHCAVRWLGALALLNVTLYTSSTIATQWMYSETCPRRSPLLCNAATSSLHGCICNTKAMQSTSVEQPPLIQYMPPRQVPLPAVLNHCKQDPSLAVRWVHLHC